MRVAVLSDVHANRQAFEAVLADVARAGAQETWCLGDVVGYGGDPDACVALVREHCDLVLAGNHDLAVTGALDPSEFSGRAGTAVAWTRSVIGADALDWLRTLAPTGAREGVSLYHASPRDPVWEYVVSALLAELCLDAQEARVCLVGHSHLALSFWRPDGRQASVVRREEGDVLDVAAGEWLLNPGSVGQPRDGDPRAAWLLLDTATWTADWRRTAYDVAGAQAAIRAAGLPGSLAERLGYGQ